MNPQDDRDCSKGEPVKPSWFEASPPAQSPSDRSNSLEYRSRETERNSSKELKNGSAIGFGVLGALGAIGLGILTVAVLANEPTLRGMELPFVGLMVVTGVGGAIALNWVARWRGFFPGFLVGVGLFFLCPIVTVAIICGGFGNGRL